MKIKEVRIGQSVRHPQYDGTGDVTKIEPNQIEVFFNHGKTTLNGSEIEKLIPLDTLDANQLDIHEIITKAVEAALDAIKTSEAQNTVAEMAKKFQQGKLILQPLDASLLSKEIDLETFFHKIVMVRDNLRVLEQKINSHKVLSEQEKVDLHIYLTRIAGSLTTFNSLFKEKEGYF